MYQDCVFDKDRDISETSQSGYVDLYDLLSHGVLPPDLNVAPETFNDIDDPRSIYGRPSDQFEAMTMARELNKRGEMAQAIHDERVAAQT